MDTTPSLAAGQTAAVAPGATGGSCPWTTGCSCGGVASAHVGGLSASRRVYPQCAVCGLRRGYRRDGRYNVPGCYTGRYPTCYNCREEEED